MTPTVKSSGTNIIITVHYKHIVCRNPKQNETEPHKNESMDSLKTEREKQADVKFCLHILPLIVFIRTIQKGKRKKIKRRA